MRAHESACPLTCVGQLTESHSHTCSRAPPAAPRTYVPKCRIGVKPQSQELFKIKSQLSLTHTHAAEHLRPPHACLGTWGQSGKFGLIPRDSFAWPPVVYSNNKLGHRCCFFPSFLYCLRPPGSKVSLVTLDFYCYRISFIFILLVFQIVYSENSDVFKQITAKHLDRILKKCIWYDKDVKCQKEKSFVLDVAGCCNRMLHY